MASDQERLERLRFQRKVLQGAVALTGLAAVVWLAFRLSGVLFMVFVAVFAAVALEPPVHFLVKRGWRRGAAAGAVFLAVLALSLGFLGALAPLFVQQVNQMVELIPLWVDDALAWVDKTFEISLSELGIDDIGGDIAGGVQKVGGILVGGVIGLTAGVAGFLILITTVALFTFYMLAELPKLQRTVLQWMPEDRQRRALHIWDLAVEKMGGYIYSRLVLAFVSAAISTTFLAILGMPFALSLGIWIGVLSQFIPVVGAYLAAVLPAIVALSSRGLSTMAWVIVFFTAYQQVENYVFSPRITRRAMEIHPAVSVAAILIGANLMGGIGVVLALPVAGIIQAIIAEAGGRHKVVDREAGDDEAGDDEAARAAGPEG